MAPRTKTKTATSTPEEPAVEQVTPEPTPAPEPESAVEPEDTNEPTPEPEPEPDSPDEGTKEDGDAPSDGDDTSTTLTAPSAPLTAPPEPPAPVEQSGEDDDSDAPQPAGNLGAALVRNAVPGSRLVDQRTGEAPDPETLFTKVPGPGSMYECSIRLCQDTWFGPHANPVRQLVMPKGQTTSAAKADQILGVLRAQIEAADVDVFAAASAN